MVLHTLTACAALCLTAGIVSGQQASSPRPLGSPPNATDNCYRIHSRAGEVSGEAHVTVSVSAEGRVTGAASAPGTPEPLASAAQCVAVTMKFEPARDADGQPMPGKSVVSVGFPTPPQLRQDLGRAIQYCQPALQPLVTLNNAYEGTLDLLVKVGKDGRVLETVLPEGVLPWMEEAAACLKDRLDFYPARLRLEAVESWIMVPVDFNLTRGQHERVRLDPPTVRSA
jgi:outer membrane biosynthesis protein TonB